MSEVGACIIHRNATCADFTPGPRLLSLVIAVSSCKSSYLDSSRPATGPWSVLVIVIEHLERKVCGHPCRGCFHKRPFPLICDAV